MGKGVKLDLKDKKFNRLQAIEEDTERTKLEWKKFRKGLRTTKPTVYWKFKCDCGKIISISGTAVANGRTKSCGCLMREKNGKRIGNLNRKENKYDLKSKEYGIGITTNDIEFYFDKEDFDRIKEYKWYSTKNKYIYCYDRNGHNMFLHNFVLNNINKEKLIDHKNRKPYDNRKSNLRFVSTLENGFNKGLPITNKSGFIGVNLVSHSEKRKNRWRAYITANYKRIELGKFATKEKAIRARLKAELKYFGKDFAPQRDLFEEYGIKIKGK